MKNNLYEIVLAVNNCIQSNSNTSNKLHILYDHLAHTDVTNLHSVTAADLGYAMKAIECAIVEDYSGVASQYQRLVSTTKDSTGIDRVFFTLWRRTSSDKAEPFFAICQINRRNLDLLHVTRSVPFVEKLVKRLGASDYPPAILSSRVQGVKIEASAGIVPQVLFADFVEMGNSNIDSATAGGLLFNAFSDNFLSNQLGKVEQAFPSVAKWLEAKNMLKSDSLHLLTTAHVQAHDLCGHCVPYNLTHKTRVKADWFLRAPLEEYYADTQAMWIYSSPVMRPFLMEVLSEDEIDTVPILIAMKRLTFYATLAAEDHDARCAWMFFSYWRKSGLIHNDNSLCGAFTFETERLFVVINQMLSDLLRIEYAIGKGVDEYEKECCIFSQRFGYENPVTKQWNMPDDLRFALGHDGISSSVPIRL